MFKFGEGALGDEIKDTEISFSEVPMFNTDISPEEAMSFWDKQFESVPEISMKDILNRSEDEFSFDYDLSNMKELMDKFAAMLRKEPSLGYVYRLAHESERMLYATLHGDTKTMNEILEYVHNTEIPLLSYNYETELSAIVNLIYLAARDLYQVEREEKAGIGYVDFIFYPYDKTADCLILELKVDHTPEEAIKQIIEKKYAMKFQGKIGQKPLYTGRILAVGISYDKKNKVHACKVQELEK